MMHQGIKHALRLKDHALGMPRGEGLGWSSNGWETWMELRPLQICVFHIPTMLRVISLHLDQPLQVSGSMVEIRHRNHIPLEE